MQIKSNTKGKLNKILNGTVFESPLTFINEMLQNSYRAKANKLDIFLSLDAKELVFKDDGCGLKDPESLLTFDFSDWKSTDEGFGIGFWSVLAIEDIEEISIISRKHRIKINVEKAKEDLEVEYFQGKMEKGFEVRLKSNYFANNYESLKAEITEKAKTMNFNVYLDHILIEKVDIFEKVKGDFVMEFENRLFKAKFSPSSESYMSPDAYYELRKVRSMYDVPFLEGSIEVKKKAINLKEPDRNQIVMDSKYSKFKEKAIEAGREFYKSFLETIKNDEESIIKYSEALSFYLKNKDFEDLIKVSFACDVESSSLEEITPEAIETLKNVEEIFKNSEKPIAQRESQLAEDFSKKEDTFSSSSSETLKEVIKRRTPKFWVESSMVENYSDNIGLAKYYGAGVIEAKTSLVQSYMMDKKVPHVKDLFSYMIKDFEMKDNEFSTLKEEYFIEMLSPIVKRLNLNEDTFSVARISQKITFLDGDKNPYRTKKFNVEAVRKGNKVIFNRKSLELHRFSIDKNTEGYGKNEFKCIMFHLNTIAHELAHLLYNTVDNTKKHNEMERYLERVIIEEYLKH